MITLGHDQGTAERTEEEQAIDRRPAVFDGRGTIRGRLFMAPGTEVPANWTLTVEPSATLEGRERAVTRVLERKANEVEFRVDDLPQAGYVVRASAPGMNSSAVSVLLARGLEDQYVQLRLSPAGFLDGGITTKRGAPAEGIRVVLESVRTKLRSETESDISGNYLFREVLDGEYRLYFGSPDNPILPVESISFRAPSLRFPTRALPHDGELVVTVTDADGNPIANAQIRGWGSEGAAIEATTDDSGQAEFRYLPAGDFKVSATSQQITARRVVRVHANRRAQVTLRIEG